MTGWLAAVPVTAVVYVAVFVLWVRWERRHPPGRWRQRARGTAVARWQPTPPTPPQHRPEPEAEFGRAVLEAADRYHQMFRP